MKTMLHGCLALVIGACTLLSAGAAEAVTFWSPFGDEPVAIQIGFHEGTRKSVVSFRRLRDNACVWHNVGSPTIEGTVSVFGGAGNDYVSILAGNETVTCAIPFFGTFTYTLSPPFQTATSQIFTSGKEGNDVLTCSSGWAGTARNWCSGDEDNDWIFNYGPRATVLGGPDNDIIWSSSGSAETRLYGNEGNDCLQWVNNGLPPPNVVDCGSGTDKRVGPFNTGTSCEIAATSCF